MAAPLTPTNQEVAGYINYSAQFVPYLGWRLVRNSFPGPYRIGRKYIDCVRIILDMFLMKVQTNKKQHTVVINSTL